MAGLIAREFGAEIGGLFLAFPAIFPASATLIEKHENQKKQKFGMNGAQRGRLAASADAAGAAMGSVGLLVFAIVMCRLLSRSAAWLVFTGATLAWLGAAVTTWYIRKLM
jgi:Protein of unknown function (DUF3147)